MSINVLLSIAVAVKFLTLDNIDSVLSILEHLIVIASIIITPYLTDKKCK